jgi:hypothetical protein
LAINRPKLSGKTAPVIHQNLTARAQKIEKEAVSARGDDRPSAPSTRRLQPTGWIQSSARWLCDRGIRSIQRLRTNPIIHSCFVGFVRSLVLTEYAWTPLSASLTLSNLIRSASSFGLIAPKLSDECQKGGSRLLSGFTQIAIFAAGEHDLEEAA